MSSIIVLLTIAGLAAAVPSIHDHNTREASPPQGKGAMPLVAPPFDAASQSVSTSGEHRWAAPGPGDDRGPCPALNALANQ